MTIKLAEVTRRNFHAVIGLQVDDAQQGYVASNLYSLAEAKFHASYYPRAIYLDDAPVGFLMYALNERPDGRYHCEIFRFMVDKYCQGQGVGREAMALALAEIWELGTVDRVTICYVPSNPVARDFYGSFGFVEVGSSPVSGEITAEIRAENGR